MKNFKEIAEKCLAGELSGTFVFQNGQTIISSKLQKFHLDSPFGMLNKQSKCLVMN
jgi:hypothetical protein